jgi:DTW domain-containing protein YfiP
MPKLSSRKSGNRCLSCRMLKSLCFCELMPKFKLSNVELILAIHYREARHTTNSGQLAAQIFLPSHTLVRGLPGEAGQQEEQKFQQLIAEPGFDNLVLFPHEEAIPLPLGPNDRKYRLWAPDGNWKQGKKIANRLLQQVPGARAVSLPFERLSTYQLRRESHPEKMSTFEAIARALSELDGNSELREQGDQIFQLMVHRALYSRGHITQDEMKRRDLEHIASMTLAKS